MTEIEQMHADILNLREAVQYAKRYARQGFPALAAIPPIYTADEFEKIAEQALSETAHYEGK